MIYFDTSYIAKCYLNEPGADKVRILAAESPVISCCKTGEVELVAVFHRHLREGKISREEHQTLLLQFQSDQAARVWTWIPVTNELLDAACESFHQLPSNVLVRAADAIHLLCARQNGILEIYSNDRHMLLACNAYDLLGKNILL